MSGGGPPHHPHNRHVPPTNSAWNHLSVPGYFRRQPQAAHMPTEHSLLHQPSWHTPTTEAMKFHPHSMINEIFKNEARFARDCVDLSLARNGTQNGEPLPNPGAISLSVRDATKINSLPASMLEIQAVELTKCPSPSLKPAISPGSILVNARKSVSPGPKAASPGLNLAESGKSQKRSNVRVDSILERLNPIGDKTFPYQEIKHDLPPSTSVIVSATSNFDENSNSSGTNVPTPKEDDSASMSNEDSLDSTKSRRKRKPSKTVRVNKEDEVKQEPPENIANILESGEPAKVALLEPPEEEEVVKTRRKTSSESETIDNIAAMVQEALKEKERSEEEVSTKPDEKTIEENVEQAPQPEPVSVIKPIENLDTAPPEEPEAPVLTPAQKKATITQFVEVENKLEEMFAGIVEEQPLEPKKDELQLTDDSFLKLDESDTAKPEPENSSPKKTTPKKALKKPVKKEDSGEEEVPAKKKKLTKPMKKISRSPLKKSAIATPAKMLLKNNSTDSAKEVYAYDSGSNASSSKSRGPFVQIRGPRDSPLSVCVVNTPLAGDEDGEQRRPLKNKKFHDDSEYRHKVRSKGLHCSTLSNKYDAERKDTSWICAFCKRGPHANDISGPSAVPSAAPPPGDLFGPYIITTQCPEFEKRLDDPYDRQFKSRKIGKVLDAANNKTSKKTKRKSESLDPTDIMLGITDTGHNTYEVWMHEDCMVWSPGVYLVGPKILGLEEAVWTCSNVQCTNCGLKGANVTCVKRGCLASAHLCCARKSTWQLLDEDFKAYCVEHMR